MANRTAALLCSLLFLVSECFSLKAPPGPGDEDAGKISLNAFSMTLYQELTKGDASKNLFFSPYSIATVLAMVSAGTKGKTNEEIMEALNWDNSTDIHEEFGKLLTNLRGKGQKLSPSSLNIANRIWIQKGMGLKSNFRKILNEDYDSKVGKNDYLKEPEKSRKKINEWVKKNTGNQIVDFLKKDTIDTMTRLVITNAMYFKASWKTPFDPYLTSKQKFYTSADESTKVKMMDASLWANVASGPDEQFAIIELPYAGRKFSMMLVLPGDDKNLGDIADSLDFNAMLGMEYKPMKIQILLPKFKIRSQSDLTQSLSNRLGVRSLFSPACDLSGMFKKPDGIFVTQAFHEAFVEVDEKGTKASAATALVAGRSFLPMFIFNKPFLFFIKDNMSDVVIFAGRYATPE